MKLQILGRGQASIGGYNTLIIDRNDMDLSSITDNECDFILASDVADFFPANFIERVIAGIVQKLRLNGEVVFGGTDVRLFSKAVFNGLITEENASNIVTSVNSMTSSEQVKNIFQKMGLQILSVYIDGLHYEVKAKRLPQ
jgi:hypothetical protein